MTVLPIAQVTTPQPVSPNSVVTQETLSPPPPLVRQILKIGLRRRWVIIGATLTALLLGILVTLLMTPKFSAKSTIEISREADQVTDLKGVQQETSVSDQEFYQTQYGLLRSQTLAERVASELQLVDSIEFFDMFGEPADNLAFVRTSGRYAPSGRRERQRVAGELLLENLVIDPARFSRLVTIYFTSPDAEFSAKVTNSWSENFIRTNLERKIQSTSYGRDLLQQQLTEYKERLEDSQRQLVDYASKEQIINLPSQAGNDGKVTSERSITADNLAALNSALTEATADRIRVEARFRKGGRGGASEEALNNTAINGLRERRAILAADYERLLTQFEPNYPSALAIKSQIDQLDRSIAREEGRVTASLDAAFREAQGRENALLARVEGLKSEYLNLRRRSIQYNVYQQEVDTNRELYDGLLQRFKEIGVAGGVGVNNISVVDLAYPPKKPSSPRLLLNLLVAIVAGFGLGALIAFILEQLDEAISDPAEIQQLLGIALLGTVPKSDEGTPQEALMDRKSDLFEAYLSVQTNLSFTTEHGVPRSFAITSTRASEGKSTTSLALATILARGGKKVILLDGDMRSPSIHHFGDVDHSLGLSNFLSGENAIEPLIFEMEGGTDLAAMSAGPIPPNAGELLAGPRLSQLISKLLETYDHVVVDAPPVMGLADAPLIANHVEAIIYVVEFNGIRSNAVKSAVTRLRSANAKIIGGVLTKFDARKASYGYEYGYGYGREGEKDLFA